MQILERKARLKISYKKLDNEYKDLASDSELKKAVNGLQKSVKDMHFNDKRIL